RLDYRADLGAGFEKASQAGQRQWSAGNSSSFVGDDPNSWRVSAINRQTKSPLTANQRRGFAAAWGGWTLDGMDSFIYALVMVPALRELLPRSGITGDAANIGYYGGLLFALFLVGWGMSLVWGPIADRFGR